VLPGWTLLLRTWRKGIVIPAAHSNGDGQVGLAGWEGGYAVEAVGSAGTRIFKGNQSSILMEDWVNGWSSGDLGTTSAQRNFMNCYGLLSGRGFVRV